MKKILPKKDLDTEITAGGAGERIVRAPQPAGKNMVIDGPALKIIKESRLSTYVINGKKISELEKVIENKEFNGTEIKI